MPGLRLTLKQAQRLWGMDEQTCVSSLRVLVDAKFLVLGGDQTYTRLTEGAATSLDLRMAKATLGGSRPKGQRRIQAT